MEMLQIVLEEAKKHEKECLEEVTRRWKELVMLIPNQAVYESFQSRFIDKVNTPPRIY